MGNGDGQGQGRLGGGGHGDRAGHKQVPRAYSLAVREQRAGAPGWGLGGGGGRAASIWPETGPGDACLWSPTRPPIARWQGCYSPILWTKKPGLMGLAPHGSLEATGPAGASQALVGWAGEGEGGKAARNRLPLGATGCRRVPEGALPSQGHQGRTRAQRLGISPPHPAGPPPALPLGQWGPSCPRGEFSGSQPPDPWPWARLQALLGKTYLTAGGSSLRPLHPEPTHLPELTPTPQTLAGSRQGSGLPVSP